MKIIIIALMLSATAFCSKAQHDVTREKNFNLRSKVALEGYDPVSYFQGRPTEGEKEISFVYQGITYFFSSIANQNRFKSNPAKFEPAYGGWCAYAMGNSGEKVKVDPETFKIVGGRLFLFYNFWGSNTLEDWNENESALLKAADQNWKKFLQ